MKLRKSCAILIGWLLSGVLWSSAYGQRRAPVAPPVVKGKKRPKPTRRVVMLAARDQARASKELHGAVAGQLSDASVALELRWVKQFAAKPPAQLAQARKIAKGRKIVVVFWCDLSAKGEIFLYLVEPGRGRLIVRSVAKAGGGGRAESVGIIVGMSVRAILSSLPRRRPAARPRRSEGASRPVAEVRGSRPGEVGPRRPIMPLSADNPLFREGASLNRQRKPRGPRWLALEMGYALDLYGEKIMAAGSTYPASSGASIGVAARLGKRWAAFVSFRITEPIKAKGDTVQTSLQRYPLSTGARLRFQLGRWVELAAALSFTFDYVAVDTKAPEGRDVAQGNTLHFLIGGEARLSIRAVDRLRFYFVLGAEVGLNPKYRYWPVADRDQPIIIDPWPIQPYFRFGIALDLI